VTRAVGVFAGSRPGSDPAFTAAAVALGTAIGERGHSLVYGGGAHGLMGTTADACLAAGGTVIGVIPEGLFPTEVAHAGLTELHVVATIHARKALMYELSDGFVALPGGIGTFDELIETLTWRQLGLHGKPCALLDVGGYFAPFVGLLDGAISAGFVDRRTVTGLVRDPSSECIIEQLFAADRDPR
jgi:uncharacterized protein (TIGR00730 family)